MIDQRKDRRTELRLLANSNVPVTLVDGDIVRPGTLVDVSTSGARIRMLEPLQVGRKVELRLDEHNQRFACTVIWATHDEIGIQFDAGDVARTDH